MTEIWKEIKGFNGRYEISNLGSGFIVESFIAHRLQRLSEKESSKGGYATVWTRTIILYS